MTQNTKVWVTLVIFTLFAFLLGWLKLMNIFFILILLLTTFIKGQLVIDYFMGLHDVSLRWRLIPSAWLFVVIIVIGVAYYFPANSL